MFKNKKKITKALADEKSVFNIIIQNKKSHNCYAPNYMVFNSLVMQKKKKNRKKERFLCGENTLII